MLLAVAMMVSLVQPMSHNSTMANTNLLPGRQGNACEVIRNGSVVKTYASFQDAVAKEPVPNYYGSFKFTELESGDTIRLLADCNHTTGLVIERLYGDDAITELTIDLNGHKLNLSNTDEDTLVLHRVMLNIIHDKPGSEFNLSVTGNPAEDSNKISVMKLDGDTSEQQWAGVNYISSITAKGKNVVGISGNGIIIEEVGRINIEGLEGSYNACIDASYCTVNVSGDVVLVTPLMNLSSSAYSNAVSVSSRSEVTIGGNVTATNGVGINAYGFRSAYDDQPHKETVVIVHGDIQAVGGVNCHSATVEVFGSIISISDGEDQYPSGIRTSSGGRVTVHGNVEMRASQRNSSAVDSGGGGGAYDDNIVVLGSVFSDFTGVSHNSGSRVFVAGDVVSTHGSAIYAGDASTYLYDERGAEIRDDKGNYLKQHDPEHVVHVGGNVIPGRYMWMEYDEIDEQLAAMIEAYPDIYYIYGQGVHISPNARVVIDGEIITTRGLAIGEGDGEQPIIEIVSEPARAGYITHKVSWDWDDEDRFAYVWLRDPDARQSVAYLSGPTISNGTNPTKSYADAGDTMNLSMIGSPGARASAVITYSRARQQTDSTMTVSLSENQTAGGSASTYAGSFVIDDMAQIKSIEFSLSTPGTSPQTFTLPASRLPLIRGSLRVNINNQYRTAHPALKIEGLLTASGARGGNSMNVSLTESASFVLKGLPAGANYSLELRGHGYESYGSVTGIEVQAGVVTEVDFVPVLSSRISVMLKDDTDGEWMRMTQVMVREVATGEITSSLYTKGSVQSEPSGKAYPIGTVLELICAGGLRTAYIAGEAETRCYRDVKHTVTVAPSGNEFIVPYELLQPDAVLTGKITLEGAPVKGASVNVSQEALGSFINLSAVTDDNGNYSVQVYPGFPTTAVVTYAPGRTIDFASRRNPAVIPGQGSAANIDFQLVAAMPIKLNIRHFSQYLGEDEPTEQLFGGTMASHQNFSLYNHRTRQTVGITRTSDMSVVEGDIITMTYGGYGGLPLTTYELTVASDGSISQDIVLVQTGATVDFRLVGVNEGGSTISRPFIQVSDSQTGASVNFTATNNGGGLFTVWISEAGSYRLDISYNRIDEDPEQRRTTRFFRATREITLRDGQMLDLGDITCVEESFSLAEISGQVTVTPQVVSPGSTVTVKASYLVGNPYNNIDSPDTLVMQVPAGTTFVPGSLTLNNKSLPDPVFSAGRSITMQLPDDEISEGFAAFRVTVDQDIALPSTFASVTMGSVNLGTAEIVVEILSISVPDYAQKRDIFIKGYAPAGSLVSVYDRGAPIGSTTASPVGNWSAKVILPGSDGVKRLHEIHAEATINGETRATEAKMMTYDPSRPQIQTLFVYDSQGHGVREFDASSFPIAFPYVYWIHTSHLDVAARFTDNTAVTDVEFTIESGGFTSSAPGVFNEVTSLFEARIPNAMSGAASGASTGSIYVDYTPVPKFDPKAAQTPLTEDEYRASLPSALSGYEVINADAVRRADGAMVITAELVMPSEDTVTKIEIVMQRETIPNANMSASDMTLFEQTGIPAFNVHAGSSHDPASDLLTITSSLSIPESWFEEQGYNLSGVFLANNLMPRTPTVQRVAVTGALKVISIISTIITTGTSITGTIFDLTDQSMLEHALKKECDNERNRVHLDYARLTMKVKSIMQWIGGMLPLVYTFLGLVGVITGGVSIVCGLVLTASYMVADYYMGEIVKEQLNYIPKDCFKKQYAKLLAHWIYDPSGVIYEVTLDNPLQGVKTTALWLQNGVWEVWDAEFYEQANPLLTGADGWYAWDVPSGLWKVMYEKDGYETVFSEEMEVPPIRTDVNIAMESSRPAALSGVYYSPEGLSIVFDKHALITDLNADSVEVYSVTRISEGGQQADSELLSGSISAVDPVSYNGEVVARRFIFTPSEKMGEADHFVEFSPAIRSYNRIPTGLGPDGSNIRVQAGEEEEEIPENREVVVTGNVTVSGITLSEERITLRVGGSARKLTATIMPANAANKNVVWSTCGTGIITVDQEGLVTPLSEGTCIVTVTTEDGGFWAECTVKVESSSSLGLPQMALMGGIILLVALGVLFLMNQSKKKVKEKPVVTSAMRKTVITQTLTLHIFVNGSFTPGRELSYGDIVTVLDSSDANWDYVEFRGEKGYLQRVALAPTAES